jgi:hypothetical protein
VQTHRLIKPGDHHRELENITSGANSPVNLTWGSPQGTRDHHISANSPVNLTWGSPQGTRDHHINKGVFNLFQHFEISYSRNTNKHITIGVYITIRYNYRLSNKW